VEDGMDSLRKGKEMTIASHCKWNPRAGQEISVQRSERRNNHGHCDPLGTTVADE